MQLAQVIAVPVRELLEVNESLIAESARRNARLTGLVNLFRIAFLIAGPIVGILCGLWVARRLHRSISQISITLKGATGELDQEVGRVEVSSPGDLPALQQQVQSIAEHIRNIVDELEKTRRQAMLSERLAAVGELAAGVAHELRNPLTAVKLLIQTAARKQPTSVLGQTQLHVVEQEILRMENTIQGLLDFAKPPRLQQVHHDLRDTVRRAANLAAGRAAQQQVTIAEDFPRTPIMIDGDPEQLHQVFVNLSLNGIEAMPKGGTLNIAIRSDEATGLCRVVFTDTGIGIPRNVLDRLFEPFVTSKERGTGLGLAISRRITQEHHGQLLGINRDGAGAVFTVELPLQHAKPGNEHKGAAADAHLSCATTESGDA